MKTKIIAAISFFFAVLIIFSIRLPATAAPMVQLTPFPTPTPAPDGRILYVVQDGDTLWRIAAVSEITIDELRLLNNLGVDDIIRPGETLLLGLAGPSDIPTQPIINPTPLPGNVTPTATPGPGIGMVCIFLYEDENGDAFRQDNEFSIPDGQISLTNRSGSVSLQGETVPGPATEDDDPPRTCFLEVLEGDYNITVAVPDGYNPTTILNYALKINAGEEALIDFGAQLSTEAIEEVTLLPEEGGQRSPLLGVVGGIFILGGILLAFIAARSGRVPKSPKGTTGVSNPPPAI